MRAFALFLVLGCGNETALRVDVDAPRAPRASSCEDASTERQALTFEAREGCSFSEDGNLERRNEHIQARADEARFVSLPPPDTLCGLSLVSKDGPVSFDDHLAILIDDIVVVSGGSGLALDEHPERDGLPRFDWEDIAGRPFSDRYADYRCLGEGRCEVPRTEEVGTLDVRIDPETMASIATSLDWVDGLDVRIVTFGDDDWADCAHTDLTLDVVVETIAR
ncbi:MAG: hypothetical protein AAGA48_29515 [Myxococcota bacterium]